ncbi:MAG TPA: hypothetical protein VHQ03_04860 [Candidatus Dormibacteraeota bacterium]|nr:hypothetical protein [Candidatus Dormibacteraeota bacterium]
MRRWVWPLLIGGLVLVGVILVVADIALGPRWPSPMAGEIYNQKVVKSPGIPPSQMFRFDRSRLGDKLVFETPIAGLGPLNPYEALRAFLSNGAGLVLLALAALVLFPARARTSVERLEANHGAEIAFGAGLVLVLLTFAFVTLLRFTLIFLAVVPFVLGVTLIAALFGIACIALAIGRLLNRRLNLPPVHPLVAALAGALVVFDLAVIPYAGVFALAAVAIGGLGLAVVTRFGSSGGWSFGDLNW